MTQPVAKGSIRTRLLISLLLSSAVLAVVVFFLVQSVARQVAQQSQDNVLAASAISILDSARFTSGQLTVDLPYAALSMLDNVTDERVFYTIRLEREFLSGYAELPEAVVTAIGEPAFLSTRFLEEEVRIASIQRPVSTDVGQKFLQVSVAQTLSGQALILGRISRNAMTIGGGFFFLSVVLAAFIARGTIRPVKQLTASVSRRGPSDLRPVTAPLPSEMVPLVTSLNTLMSRLRTSLARSEEFIAEAAHRVRTPLAIVRTKAEIVQRTATEPEHRKAVLEMIHAIDESSRTAGQLLDHAMVTFRLDQLASAPVDLAQIARDTVGRLGPISDLKDIHLTTETLEEAVVEGDPILLQNALHNLMDNAIKYAPSGASVIVDVQRQPKAAVIRVRDTGPGFPEQELAVLANRFQRGSNAQGVVGSGLGLTIVREVTEAHGGQMQIENQSEGGACVTLHFPLS